MEGFLLDTDIISYVMKKNPTVLENYDILIAGIAIANNLKLVTNNEKDYENMEGLEIVNWTSSIYTS